MAPIALYSAPMSHLGADRGGQWRLLRPVRVTLHAHRHRPSRLHRQLLGGGGGLKLHSLSGRGFVQQGLFAIRHQAAAGKA